VRGRNLTQVGKAWEWWISADGWRWGRKTSGECRCPAQVGIAKLGSYSEVDPKPEEGHHGSDRTWCPRCENREVDSEPRGGRRQTHEALGRGDVFGRQVNHTRGALRRSDALRVVEFST
jgi:hypothetical protein